MISVSVAAYRIGIILLGIRPFPVISASQSTHFIEHSVNWAAMLMLLSKRRNGGDYDKAAFVR